MKTLTRISLILALLVIVSCSSTDELISPEENSLVGNWKLVNVTIPNFPDAVDHGKQIGSILSLKPNNDYTLNDGRKVIYGKWFIEEGYLRLYYQSELLIEYDEYKLSVNQLKMTYYWINEERSIVYVYYEDYVKL